MCTRHEGYIFRFRYIYEESVFWTSRSPSADEWQCCAEPMCRLANGLSLLRLFSYIHTCNIGENVSYVLEVCSCAQETWIYGTDLNKYRPFVSSMEVAGTQEYQHALDV